MLWRKNSSAGILIAGTGVSGTSLNKFSTTGGLKIDSQGNIYVVDHGNNRVMKYAQNATSGTLVAGISGVVGSNNSLFDQPYELDLDENNSYIYIADLNNNRIQRYQFGVPDIGITVAGGNGPGSNDNQLYWPTDVCISKKTGDLYISDFANHRIQRWSPGATSGVTVAGVTGISGTNATLLNGPFSIALNHNQHRSSQVNKSNQKRHRTLVRIGLIVVWIVLFIVVYYMSPTNDDNLEEFDPFLILDVDEEASNNDIRHAYHELSKQHHPDQGGDPENFKKLVKAYKILTDETAKENWRMYGNPDGQKELHLGYAIPL
ncbi:unnamed protein product [Adineta steineri]|uniref:J domain-containing protein n=1 Tax=Adineta steineri TaxID=433720 RepID=A0A814U6T5_9BILA|nr:unnamed protein product [Adineta steineri]CAF1393774.1 unnamed protein product [Adineta steineri]